MIYQTIDTASQLRDEFRKHGRQDTYSYEGFDIVFDYLENMGEDVELDVVGLCCDVYEAHWTDVLDDYLIDVEDIEDEDEKRRAVIGYLQEETTFLGETRDGNLLYVAF